MKYQQPYGISDPDASYINADRPSGRIGSIPPAAAMEQPQREIVNLIKNSQQVPNDSDLEQLTRGVRDGKLNYCRDSGGINMMQVTLSPPLQRYEPGLVLRVIAAHTTTGPANISCDALNPVSIRRRDGTNLQNRDILQGQIATLVYDGSFFQLQNMGVAEPVEAEQVFFKVEIPYVRDTSVPTDGNHCIGLYSPPLPDINEGRTVEIKLNRAVTGPTVFTPNNFPTKPVARPDGSPVQAGDGVTNQIWLLVFDSEQWQIIGSRFDWVEPEPEKPAYVGRSLQFTYGNPYGIDKTGFNSFLKRTPSMNTDRQVFTVSFWIRHPNFYVAPDITNIWSNGSNGQAQYIFSAGYAGMGGDLTGLGIYGTPQGNECVILWANSMWLVSGISAGGAPGYTAGYWTIPIHQDALWHHGLLVADGANVSYYLDGVLVNRGASRGPGPWNAATEHRIGGTDGVGTSAYGCSGRITEWYMIDGQAISDYKQFAELKSGVLVPKMWTGNFGPNGCYLNWQDSSAVTANTLGKDWSGNNNNWTPVNFRMTDIVPDYPGKVN